MTAHVYNCTVTGNTAQTGGCVLWGICRNCIVYYNTAPSLTNYGTKIKFDYCCTFPLPTSGAGNITNEPLFVDLAGGNLRLQSNSPCINAGNNAFAPAGPDLDGNPRIAGGKVDIGAFEFQAPASKISYSWLQRFNLPINSATDTADPDGDGVDNYHEWLAGSDPTNPFSFPAQLTIMPSGTNVILTWPTNAFGFTLQSTHQPCFTIGLEHQFTRAGCHRRTEHSDQSDLRGTAVLSAGPVIKGSMQTAFNAEAQKKFEPRSFADTNCESNSMNSKRKQTHAQPCCFGRLRLFRVAGPKLIQARKKMQPTGR